MSTLSEKHLIGLVIASDRAKPVVGLELPDAGSHTIVTVGASDLRRNSVSFLSASMPIFADGATCYVGQPVLAVFAETIETARLYADRVRIAYGEDEPEEFSETVEPRDWKFGNVDAYFSNEDNKVFCSSFRMARHERKPLSSTIIECTVKGSELRVKAPTQWPLNLKANVAESLGVDRDGVQVSVPDYYAPFDEFMVFPSLMAPVAAMAALKSGMDVQLLVDMPCAQPEVIISRTSCYDRNNRILADRIDASADLGAWPLFADEYMNSMLAGFVSAADTKAISMHLVLRRSPNAPASFFGDLGYSVAIASTQSHINMFCRSIKALPTDWRTENLCKAGNMVQSIRQSSLPEELPACINWLGNLMDYRRKKCAYGQKDVAGGDIRIINYERGVGFACGESINGFAHSTMDAPKGGISITLHENGTVLVSCGIPPRKSVMGIWKGEIRKRLGVAPERISFVDINDPDVEDIGPAALSSSICVVTALIEKACVNIAERKGREPYPISARASIQQLSCDALYRSSSTAAIGVELHMDPVMLTPVLDKVVFCAAYSSVKDRNNLAGKISHIISNTISELCPLCPGPINIDVRIRDAEHDEHAGSSTSLVRGLAAAALVDALTQAVGHEIDRLPMNTADFMAISSKEGML